MSDAEKLIELAKGKFKDFCEADEILFIAVAAGGWADYAKGKDKDGPENADNWGEKRIIKASRIEWLCCDKDAKELVTDKGIIVKGAKIEEEVDLSFMEISFPLRFYKCIFKREIDLMCSKVKVLYLNGSHTDSIQADGVKVEGSVFLRDGFRATGEISFRGAVSVGRVRQVGQVRPLFNSDSKGRNSG
jgi:hypothetical protein